MNFSGAVNSKSTDVNKPHMNYNTYIVPTFVGTRNCPGGVCYYTVCHKPGVKNPPGGIFTTVNSLGDDCYLHQMSDNIDIPRVGVRILGRPPK
jgi:hypothetical protein